MPAGRLGVVVAVALLVLWHHLIITLVRGCRIVPSRVFGLRPRGGRGLLLLEVGHSLMQIMMVLHLGGLLELRDAPLAILTCARRGGVD